MPVRFEAGRLHIEGHCTVEDALPLLDILRAEEGAAVDLSACASLHTAALQCLMAAGRPVVAAPADAGFAARLMPILVSRASAA